MESSQYVEIAATSEGSAMGYDLEHATRALSASDPKLAALISKVGPARMVLRDGFGVFETLARSIVYQQINGASAAAIFARLMALGTKGRALTPATLAKIDDEKLRAQGLSRAKTLAVRDLALHVLDGRVPSLEELAEMSNDEVIACLSQVRGIGRWSAQIFLIFRLGRPDVLPEHDYGVRKGLAYMLRKRALPTPGQLARYAERWAPYRSVASWYMWRAGDLANQAKRSDSDSARARAPKKPKKIAAAEPDAKPRSGAAAKPRKKAGGAKRASAPATRKKASGPKRASSGATRKKASGPQRTGKAGGRKAKTGASSRGVSTAHTRRKGP